MTNLFAFRATQPADMKAAIDPVGPDNDQALLRVAQDASVIVAAWGNGGAHHSRGDTVRRMLPNLHFLKLTNAGYPSHPLYLPKILKPKLLALNVV